MEQSEEVVQIPIPVLPPQVYDVEIFLNCFTVTFTSVDDEKDTKQFVIHALRNQALELLEFLNQPGLKLIGFNNIGFDYPLLHVLLAGDKWLCSRPAQEIISKLYAKAQEIIGSQRFGFGGNRTGIRHPWIPQRDVFLIWHFDNEAKACSLKWLQGAIGWRNVQDMPFDYNHWVEEDEIPVVLSYNLNDVLSTRAFYLHKKTQEKIDIRYALSEKFGLNMHNYNDPKIGESIILKRIADQRGVELWDVKQLKTEREFVNLGDCILPQVEFKTPGFKAVHQRFLNMTVREGDTRKKKGKNTEEFKVIHSGLKYFFGLGGIHAAADHHIFHDVDSCDVTGYYPNLIIANRWHPAHFPEFVQVYRDDVVAERSKYPKKSVINEGLKLGANGAFGKTNSRWSALKDLKLFLQITINGQLLLAMLAEEINESGAGQVIMANTDGLEVLVKDEAQYRAACERWQAKNGLFLEFLKYKTLAIRDVNNYIAVKEDGSTKEKGDYEVDKEFHKDHSMKVVSLAVREYLWKGVPIETYINEQKDIKPFLMMKRARTGWFESREIVMGEIESEDLPKTIRYYVSKEGISILKATDKRMSRVHTGYYATIANMLDEARPFETYNIDKRFYISQAYKLLDGTRMQKVKGMQVSTESSLF